MAGVRIKGLKEATRKIEALARAGGEEMVSGLRVVGEVIMTDIKAARPGAGVPVDEGTLRASGRVSGPDLHGAVLLSFGDASVTYALKQHEDLTLRHRVGEARYLVRGAERFAAGGGPEAALREMGKAAIAKARRS